MVPKELMGVRETRHKKMNYYCTFLEVTFYSLVLLKRHNDTFNFQI